jgi:pyruvate dehydrogenase E2 component (dihydrolipoamide acetyltransferase)
MGTNIIMPSAGQTTSDLLVVAWYKKAGDTVRRGDALFSIESDKATMDIESYAEGILLRVYHEAGETVKAGEAMAYIGVEGEAAPEDDAGDYTPIPVAGRQTALPEPHSQARQTVASNRITASPAARKAASESGIALGDLAKETGRLPVKRRDVFDALERRQSGGEAQYETASPMRKTIARRMLESTTGVPQYFVSMDVNMDAVIALRVKFNEYLKESSAKVAYHDILIKCACAAIKSHPLINASYDDGSIRRSRHVNFGLAVGLPEGLLVPVLREADQKSIARIAVENARNIERARSGSLKQEEISGGTITLSNLGMYGVDSFTAILNRPEACILAAGGILEKPVVRSGVVVSGHVMNLTATFDHRLIDGAEGASFLRDLKQLLEEPALLLL